MSRIGLGRMKPPAPPPTARPSEVQAGSLGLSLHAAVNRYLSPGKAVSHCRQRAGLDLSVAADLAGVSEQRLRDFEADAAVPELRELKPLADAIGVEMRALMEVFGHVKDDAAPESLGIAAQWDGDLSLEERARLRALVQEAAEKKRRG